MHRHALLRGRAAVDSLLGRSGSSLRAHRRLAWCPKPPLVALVVTALLLLASGSTVYAQATTIFSDDFEAGIVGWTITPVIRSLSGPPSNGAACANIRRSGNIQQTISTASYENISVSFYMGALGLEPGDEVRALWFDGAAWTLLATIADATQRRTGSLTTTSSRFRLPLMITLRLL